MNSERNELTGPSPRPEVPALRQPGEIAANSTRDSSTDLTELPTPPMGIPVPPPPPTPTGPPSPLHALWEIPGMKMLVGLVIALVVTVAGISIFSSSSGSKTDGEWDPLQFAKTKDLADLLSSRPTEVVRRLYSAIGHHDASLACAYFDDAGRQKFATDLGYPDCGKALLGLSAKVVGGANENSYANSIPSATTNLPSGNTTRVSSCEYGVTGGPSLGAFTLTKIERGLWLITGHENEPDPCPPVSDDTSNTDTPSAPSPSTGFSQSPSSSSERATTSTSPSPGYGTTPPN